MTDVPLVTTLLRLYFVDDQRLGKHVLLIHPWVKSKRSVY